MFLAVLEPLVCLLELKTWGNLIVLRLICSQGYFTSTVTAQLLYCSWRHSLEHSLQL